MLEPLLLLGPPVCYLVLAISGHFLMANRQTPIWVSSAMKLYNVAQIVLCGYMTVGLAPVVGLPNVFGLGSEYTSAGEWFVFVHYLSKLLDWLDTAWMVLKKKSSGQMSFLHLYHHATIGVVWGFLLSVGHGNGTVRYGAFINSFTHVIMYSHYLWTSFGWKNPLRTWVTTWQIIQFYSCFVHALCVLFIPPELDDSFPRNLAWIQFGYHITMIYLFTFRLRWVPALFKQADQKQRIE